VGATPLAGLAAAVGATGVVIVENPIWKNAIESKQVTSRDPCNLLFFKFLKFLAFTWFNFFLRPYSPNPRLSVKMPVPFFFFFDNLKSQEVLYVHYILASGMQHTFRVSVSVSLSRLYSAIL
jgi:hypothetical protein